MPLPPQSPRRRHSTDELGLLAGGVVQARRGWLEAADVLNARTLTDLRALLAPTMVRAAPFSAGGAFNDGGAPR